jgi:peptidyl-prolyl cis-trans isomerase D
MPNEQGKKPVLHKKHVARLQREKQQSRIILFTFIGILTAVVLLLIYGYLDMNYLQLERPVAKVGDAEIIAKQFEARVRLQRQQLLNQYSQFSQYAQFGIDVTSQLKQIETSLNTPLDIGQTVLDQMIKEELIRQESKKRGITISEAELNEITQGAFGYYPDGSPTPSITPTQFTMPDAPAEAFKIVTMTPVPSATPEITATSELAALIATLTTGTPAATATGAPSATPTATIEPTATPTAGPTSTATPTATAYTLEGYQTQVNDSTERLKKLGFGKDIYKSFFENQIYERKLKEVITADVPRSEKQVWARHILVKDETLAVSIIERLKNGEDFATLAKELSDDKGSAVNGGDLGWFGSGAMVPEFETAAFALEKPGDFTLTPVQSQFGYHIIQLIAKQDRPLTPEQYDAAKTKVFTEWLTSARKEYGVETFDLWKQHVPSDPNFETMATESADAQNTALAEQKKQATATP